MVFTLINMVLKFAPIGVFGLMAYVTADHGFFRAGPSRLAGAVNYAVMLFFMIVVCSVDADVVAT